MLIDIDSIGGEECLVHFPEDGKMVDSEESSKVRLVDGGHTGEGGLIHYDDGVGVQAASGEKGHHPGYHLTKLVHMEGKDGVLYSFPIIKGRGR